MIPVSDPYARAVEIWERGQEAFQSLNADLLAIAHDAPKQRKYFSIQVIANLAMEKVSPSTPCRKGCSHCCHYSLPISQLEARLLEEASGRKMNRWAFSRTAFQQQQRINFDGAKYKGKPCPFLVDNACSVYEHRPVQCRVHHVLEADETKCDPHGDHNVATYALDWITAPTAQLLANEQYADIREWFKATPNKAAVNDG